MNIACKECKGELKVMVVQKDWTDFEVYEDTGKLGDCSSGDFIGLDWDTATVFCRNEDEHVTGYVYDPVDKKIIAHPDNKPWGKETP